MQKRKHTGEGSVMGREAGSGATGQTVGVGGEEASITVHPHPTEVGVRGPPSTCPACAPQQNTPNTSSNTLWVGDEEVMKLVLLCWEELTSPRY